jgi:hypothetical protein
MYSPYGSYSSMGSLSQPLDIAPRSYHSSSSYQANCAFPSWPQQERATSYLSDDDLLDLEDDSRSIASSSASNASGSPYVTEQELLELQREQQAALQREALRFVMQEKERRKQAARRARGSAKKSPKSNKSSHAMAPISEAVE